MYVTEQRKIEHYEALKQKQRDQKKGLINLMPANIDKSVMINVDEKHMYHVRLKRSTHIASEKRYEENYHIAKYHVKQYNRAEVRGGKTVYTFQASLKHEFDGQEIVHDPTVDYVVPEEPVKKVVEEGQKTLGNGNMKALTAKYTEEELADMEFKKLRDLAGQYGIKGVSRSVLIEGILTELSN